MLPIRRAVMNPAANFQPTCRPSLESRRETPSPDVISGDEVLGLRSVPFKSILVRTHVIVRG